MRWSVLLIMMACGSPVKPTTSDAGEPVKPTTSDAGEPVKPTTSDAGEPVKPTTSDAAEPVKPTQPDAQLSTPDATTTLAECFEYNPDEWRPTTALPDCSTFGDGSTLPCQSCESRSWAPELITAEHRTWVTCAAACGCQCPCGMLPIGLERQWYIPPRYFTQACP